MLDAVRTSVQTLHCGSENCLLSTKELQKEIKKTSKGKKD